MIKVSVIVPVYNVEKYLDKCLNTLCHQTLKEIEIIVVNDGSPDNSEEIIKKYEKKYPKKIVYLKKENGGVSSARNYGIDAAKGEYIGFVDGDDYVEVDMFEKLYTKAKSQDFDLVVCDLNLVYDSKLEYKSSCYDVDLFDSKEIKDTYINVYPVIWNKIYKRSLFTDEMKFKLNVWHEDVLFLYKLFPYVKNIGVIKEALINYVQRENSSTKSFDDRLYDYIGNWNDTIKFYKKYKLFKDYKKELEFCYVRYLYATLIKRACNYTDKKKFDDLVKDVIDNVKNTFPHYRKNGYFYKSLKGIYLLLFGRFLANILYKRTKR